MTIATYLEEQAKRSAVVLEVAANCDDVKNPMDLVRRTLGVFQNFSKASLPMIEVEDFKAIIRDLNHHDFLLSFDMIRLYRVDTAALMKSVDNALAELAACGLISMVSDSVRIECKIDSPSLAI